MYRRMCHSKIHGATVTESRIDYVGSIQIDEDLMDASNLLEYEWVQVANMSNGERFETYVIKGKRGSGAIGLNGAAARLGLPGDKVIIFAMKLMTDEEAPKLKPSFVYVDQKNKIVKNK